MIQTEKLIYKFKKQHKQPFLYFYGNVDEFVAPGEFHFAHIIRDVILANALIILTVVAWYVNSVTTGAVIAEIYPKFCCMFKFWDAQNMLLIPEQVETSHLPKTLIGSEAHSTHLVSTLHSKNVVVVDEKIFET